MRYLYNRRREAALRVRPAEGEHERKGVNPFTQQTIVFTGAGKARVQRRGEGRIFVGGTIDHAFLDQIVTNGCNALHLELERKTLCAPSSIRSQDAASDLRFVFQGAGATAESVASTLRSLFGASQRLTVQGPVEFDAKVVQYTSALPGAEL